MEIFSVRHAWPEVAGFSVSRPGGLELWTVLLFHNRVEVLSEGRILTAESGACVIYEPGAPQWFQSPGPLCHDWMHMLPSAGAWLRTLNLPLGCVFYPEEVAPLQRLFEELEWEFFSEQPYHEEMLSLRYRELFIRLARTVSRKETTALPAEETESLYALRQELLRCPERPWTVEKMAQTVGLSPSRFFAVYQRTFGASPMDTCIKFRISAAQSRLMMTNLSVKEIALSLGYHNVCHFNRQFKALTGETPLGYRLHYRR